MPVYRVIVETVYEQGIEVVADNIEQAYDVAPVKFDMSKASHVKTVAIVGYTVTDKEEKQNG